MIHRDGLADSPRFEDSTCVFCQALEDGVSDRVLPSYNTTLGSTDNFVVLPALGPLKKGHVLVVSRAHFPSLGSMTDTAIDEFQQLIDAVRPQYDALGGNILEAEHGSTNTNSGGSCIIHTHVNLIPGLGHLHRILDRSLRRVDVTLPLRNLASTHRPYIFMKHENSLAVYDATHARSQLIRRALSTHFGGDDWDWALFPRLDLVEETITFWRGI
jgi:diadenosine tetraphosphate (Ap4A) HIT family hydrolase